MSTLSTGPSMSWKFQALRLLSEAAAPRVFDVAELDAWLRTRGLDVPDRTLRRGVAEWEAAGLVQRAVRGVYLNRQATPLPVLEEAAPRMRQGAVVSLGTVLGRAGVLNNPTHWVTAVVPSDNASKLPGEHEADDGSMFRFALLRADLVPTPGTDFAREALEPYAPVPTAVPEKALLDWIYVGSRGRGVSRWPLPPAHDWDVSGLDEGKLQSLAAHMGLTTELGQFLEDVGSQVRVKIRRRQRGP